MLIIGNVVAFIVAILAIRFFIDFLTRYGFKAFGVYRIIVGTILLILVFSGVSLTMV
jgi:undecaprenyl-diphosphatase